MVFPLCLGFLLLTPRNEILDLTEMLMGLNVGLEISDQILFISESSFGKIFLHSYRKKNS